MRRRSNGAVSKACLLRVLLEQNPRLAEADNRKDIEIGDLIAFIGSLVQIDKDDTPLFRSDQHQTKIVSLLRTATWTARMTKSDCEVSFH
jgi:hypothetical protein